MKLTKKEKKQIEKEIGDYFCNVIMSICQISNYRVFTKVDLDTGKDKTFSIKQGFPYRSINLYIGQSGVDYWRTKNWQAIRFALLHEAFHILHWTYREYAKARFIQPDTLQEIEEDLADKFAGIVSLLWDKYAKNNKTSKTT